MKIIVAYDGSRCAKAAIEDLKRAGLPQHVDALVLTVADVFLPPYGWSGAAVPEAVMIQAQSSEAISKKIVKEATDCAQEAAMRLRRMFPGWHVESRAVDDSPVWGILKTAAEWKPDLIVVGAHGLPSVARFFLGSVSQAVAMQAPCSVRIVHGRTGGVGGPVRIVIGMDGSEFAYAALSQILSRKWNKNTAVRVVTVEDPKMLTAIFSSKRGLEKWLVNTKKRENYWTKRLVEDAVRKLEARGLSVTSLTREGDPKKVLLQEAERWGADCIFVGYRGLSGLKAFFAGSVSAAVAARARCSVEIVRGFFEAEAKKSSAKKNKRRPDMNIPERLTRFLKNNKVFYQVVVHPETFAATAMAQAGSIPGKEVAKAVMAKVRGKDTMLVLPATYRVDILKLSHALGTLDVRLEKEKDFKGLFPDCETGAMPPVGRIYHVPCYVDKSIEESPEIYFNAGTHIAALKVPTQDFLKALKAKVLDFAVRGPVKRSIVAV